MAYGLWISSSEVMGSVMTRICFAGKPRLSFNGRPNLSKRKKSQVPVSVKPYIPLIMAFGQRLKIALLSFEFTASQPVKMRICLLMRSPSTIKRSIVGTAAK